jgi:hypothetical protein
MSASAHDLELTAQIQFVRAQKAEQNANDIQHAFNLLLNYDFERFHLVLTADDAVHWFEAGTVRNRPVPEGIRTAALRFLFVKTLKRPYLHEHIPFPKRPRSLPTVLSPEKSSSLSHQPRT